MKRNKVAKQSKQPGREKVDWKKLEVVHPDAAGIDVGGRDHWVAISPDRDSEPVRCFGCFTADLRAMAQWLVEKGVRSIALQSTGVYWIPVLEILEQHGLEVYLVNARHTKNVPGRKSDIQECQWLLKLHAFGLLNNSFQPPDEIRVARCQGRSESRPLRRSKRGPLWRRGQGGRLAVIGGSEGVGGYGRSVSPRTLFLRLTMVFWFWGRRSVALRRP